MAGRHARQGGNPTLSDYEVARAVVYMANKSGASLPEPAAPAEEGAKKEEAAAPAAAAPAAAAGSCRCRPGRRGSQPQRRPAAAAPRRNRPPSTRPAKSSTRASASPVTPPAWPTRQVRRQGRLGALHQDRHGRDGEGRHAGQPPMPPGGAATATEEDIRAAVQYMVDAASADPRRQRAAQKTLEFKGLLHWRTPGLPATRTRILATAPSVRASARCAGPPQVRAARHQAAAGSSSDMPSCTRRCSHRLGR